MLTRFYLHVHINILRQKHAATVVAMRKDKGS